MNIFKKLIKHPTIRLIFWFIVFPLIILYFVIIVGDYFYEPPTQEELLFRQCINDASEQYSNFWKNEYSDDLDDSVVQQVEENYDRMKDECFRKYNRGYQEYLKLKQQAEK